MVIDIHLNAPENVNYINENFVPIFINDPDGFVLSKFQENPLQYPTLIIADWNGRVLIQKSGDYSPKAIRRMLTDTVRLRDRL